jgi:hypothetical protein
MLGRSEASTDCRAATAPVAEFPRTDPLAQCKADLEQFVAKVRDRLHQMRQTLERHGRIASATATDVLPPPPATPPAAEPRGREAKGSFAPQRDLEVTAERQWEAVTVEPIAVCDSDASQAAGPLSLGADPQDQLQSLKTRLAKQLQGTEAAGNPLT